MPSGPRGGPRPFAESNLVMVIGLKDNGEKEPAEIEKLLRSDPVGADVSRIRVARDTASRIRADIGLGESITKEQFIEATDAVEFVIPDDVIIEIIKMECE